MRWTGKQYGGVKQIILKNEFIALLKHRLTESNLRQMGGKKTSGMHFRKQNLNVWINCCFTDLTFNDILIFFLSKTD